MVKNLSLPVIPAEAGIQALSLRMQGTRNILNWIPVFTGNPGFPPEFTPCLIWDGNDILAIYNFHGWWVTKPSCKICLGFRYWDLGF